MRPQAWPHLLADIVAKHGADQVYAVGLRVLGFPPTWATTGAERAEIEKAFSV